MKYFLCFLLLFGNIVLAQKDTFQTYIIFNLNECSWCGNNKTVITDVNKKLNPLIVLREENKSNFNLFCKEYLKYDWDINKTIFSDSLYSKLTASNPFAISQYVIFKNSKKIENDLLKNLPKKINYVNSLAEDTIIKVDQIDLSNIPILNWSNTSVYLEKNNLYILDKTLQKFYFYSVKKNKLKKLNTISPEFEKTDNFYLFKNNDSTGLHKTSVLYNKIKSQVDQIVSFSNFFIHNDTIYLVSIVKYPNTRNDTIFITNEIFISCFSNQGKYISTRYIYNLINSTTFSTNTINIYNNKLINGVLCINKMDTFNPINAFFELKDNIYRFSKFLPYSLPEYYVKNKLGYNFTGMYYTQGSLFYKISPYYYNINLNKLFKLQIPDFKDSVSFTDILNNKMDFNSYTSNFDNNFNLFKSIYYFKNTYNLGYFGMNGHYIRSIQIQLNENYSHIHFIDINTFISLNSKSKVLEIFKIK